MSAEVTVERRLLSEAARAGGWPAIVLPGYTLRGRDRWTEAIETSTPRERAELLLALEGPLLSATANGKARLAAVTLDDMRDDGAPLVVGDEALVQTIECALTLVPPKVRRAAVREAVFLCISTSAGWTSSARFVGVDDRPKVRAVVLGPRADMATVLHEVGHLWHAPRADDPLAANVAIGVRGTEGLLRLATRDGWDDAIREDERRQEALADGLAFVWLLRQPEARPS